MAKLEGNFLEYYENLCYRETLENGVLCEIDRKKKRIKLYGNQELITN